jgi:hypothetical protein
MRGLGAILLAGVLVLSACRDRTSAPGGADSSDAQTPAPVMLGPVDGHDLPGTEIDRVQVGQEAPDFTLASLAGPLVTLSDYRGAKNVVLVFYRGHW